MTLTELFLFFFKISSVTFGGGIVILGMVELEKDKLRGMNQEEIHDMVSLSASVPGPLAISIAWLVGRYYKGLMGSLVAITGAILPPFLIVLFVSPFVVKYSDVPAVRGFFNGVLAGTGAVIALVIFNNVKTALTQKLWNIAPFLFVITSMGVFKLHPLFAIAAGMAIQALHERLTAK